MSTPSVLSLLPLLIAIAASVQGPKPSSFASLLDRYVTWAQAHDAMPAGGDSSRLYGLLDDAVPRLLNLARPEHTRAILAARAKLTADSGWRSQLAHILGARGDASVYVPIFVSELRGVRLEKEERAVMLSAAARSAHPVAVEFMLGALAREPKSGVAPLRAVRYEAFIHLAGTGGAKGIEAVRRARAVRATLSPWSDRLVLQQLPPAQVVATTSDDHGPPWMFFESDVLGNRSDLFAARRGVDAWSPPTFTGFWSRPTWREGLDKRFDGMPPLKPLVSPRSFAAALNVWPWLMRLGAIGAIFADRDGDGLTDAVEARLGTNPLSRDTDGDGDADPVDPCPNAAPRALNDREKIVAAAIEARFFGSSPRTPALIRAPRGIRPFDVTGYAQLVIWSTRDGEMPIERLYGGGVNIIGFHAPSDDDDDDDGVDDDPRKPFVAMSKDGRTARTVITRASGGLNGDGWEVRLKKIGDEWFVVDMKLKYLS